MRKATAFRGGANKTAPPCETLSENKYFPTVPVEQLERKTFLKVLLLEKTVFNVRQKGGPPLFLPASVQQLPRCLVRICNLFYKGNQIANWKVSKKCNCSRENLLQNNLLRKCGLLAHTSAAFLKNCCTEKLSVACGLLLGNDASRETDLPHPAKGGSTSAFACQRAAIAPLPCPNLQLVSQRQSNCELESFKKVQLQQGELVAK